MKHRGVISRLTNRLGRVVLFGGHMLTEQRKGEIALAYLKLHFEKQGIKIKPDLMREVGNTAKALNIPFDEAKEFIELIIREQLDKMFAPKKGGAH